jgi:very-short-patch-repair endonuclease
VTDILTGEAKTQEAEKTRDIGEAPSITDRPKRPPRKQIVAIGIDQYRSWNRLHNAVNDARGALAAFKAHGFEEFRPALIDDAATHDAMEDLVSDDLRALGPEDSLVLFFAGHGHTVSNKLGRGTVIKDGYLIPFDADPQGGKTTSWINVKNWLAEVSKLPAKHILVILDACHSGIALDEVIRWRGEASIANEPFSVLRTRRSRRILTSALDTQLALDSGPRPGHSLFTGCLIEGLTGSLPSEPGLPAFTASELGYYVRRRVESYPSSNKQTPDFGALLFDDRGELVIDLVSSKSPPEPADGIEGIVPSNEGPIGTEHAAMESDDGIVGIKPSQSASAPATPVRDGVEWIFPTQVAPPTAATPPVQNDPPIVITTAPNPPGPDPKPVDPPPPAPPGSTLDETFVKKLDLHDKTRGRERVLSVISADALTSLAGWATWSARHGWLTVVSEEADLESVIGDVLDQLPWMRLLPAARTAFAGAVGMDAQAVDAALDKRTSAERETWIKGIAGREQIARVAGWLLTSYREPWANGPDLTNAPVGNLELLAALDTLRAPISILLHHQAPSVAWLRQAVQTAEQLIAHLPRHAVAIGASSAVIAEILRDRQTSSALALARKGVVPLATTKPPPAAGKASADQALSRALAAHPATAHLFAAQAAVKTQDNEHPVIVDLFAADALFAVQIDDWYHAPDRQSYRRDRNPDRWLQHAGIFVTRFLAEDIENRLERVVEEIALGVAARRAADPLAEKSS